jgi:hypothetical protein
MRYNAVVTSDVRKEVCVSPEFRCLCSPNCAVGEVPHMCCCREENLLCVRN